MSPCMAYDMEWTQRDALNCHKFFSLSLLAFPPTSLPPLNVEQNGLNFHQLAAPQTFVC